MLKAAERVFTALETSKFAAIGPATRGILEHEGIAVDYQPLGASAAAMAAGLPLDPGDRVVVVRGDLADGELAVTLRARGAEVDDVVAYRTRQAPEGSRNLLRTAVAGGPIAAAVFTSGSTVRGLVSLGQQESIEVHSIPAVCIGPETADAARAAGFRILAVAPTPDAATLAAITASALALEGQEKS
jgi:uroporphyrinogen-III synthase